MPMPPNPTWRDAAKAYLLAGLPFLLLDSAWLATTSASLYRPAIGHLMRADFDPFAAAAFYAIYLAGVVMFAVLPAATVRSASVRGAAFGLVCYSTYDLTNQATMLGWPWHLTYIDLAWGALVTATSAGIAHRLAAAGRD